MFNHDTIPSKIVVVGTSSVSLNDRFSNYSVPDEEVVVRPSLSSLNRINIDTSSIRKRQQQRARKQVSYNDLDDMAMEPEVEEIVEYVEEVVPRKQFLPKRKPVITTRARPQRASIVDRITLEAPPIEDRITFVRRAPTISNRGDRFGSVQRGRITKPHHIQNRLPSRPNNAVFRGRGRGAAAGRGRPPPKAQPKKSIEDLDREMDEYMHGSRHPKITM
ncbi:unnamed protein product, partial [Mesorhabditis spiculigera]